MELPANIRDEVRRRWEFYRAHRPLMLSPDGKAIRVDGSIGYDCYISPDGDVYMETETRANGYQLVVDRSRRAQLSVFALGSRTFPELEGLLPVRPAGAANCAECQGQFTFRDGFFC